MDKQEYNSFMKAMVKYNGDYFSMDEAFKKTMESKYRINTSPKVKTLAFMGIDGVEICIQEIQAGRFGKLYRAFPLNIKIPIFNDAWRTVTECLEMCIKAIQVTEPMTEWESPHV